MPEVGEDRDNLNNYRPCCREPKTRTGRDKVRNRSEYLYEKVDTIGRRRGNREKREQGRKIGGEKKQQIDRSGD